MFGKKKRERMAALEAAAALLGGTAQENDKSVVDPLDFYLLPKGSAFASDVVRGAVGATEVRVFSWDASTPYDLDHLGLDRSTNARLTCVVAALSEPVQTILLTRAQRKPAELGIPRVDVDGPVAARFDVRSRQPEAVAALTADVAFVERVLASPEDLSFELTAQTLLMVGRRREPHEIVELAHLAAGLAVSVPPGVQRHG